MSELQSLIEVVERVEEEVDATGADLRITLSGARFFAGEAALQQAAEVRKLIDALAAVGIAENDVGIASVQVNTSKGVLLKSSSATYGLTVRCRGPKLVAEAIDAVAAQKSCKLDGVSWRYDVPDETRHAWLARAVTTARAAAEAMAAALHARVTGVHRIVDETLGRAPEVHHGGHDYGYESAAAPGSMMRRRVAESLDNLELAPKKAESVRVRAWFAIASR